MCANFTKNNLLVGKYWKNLQLKFCLFQGGRFFCFSFPPHLCSHSAGGWAGSIAPKAATMVHILCSIWQGDDAPFSLVWRSSCSYFLLYHTLGKDIVFLLRPYYVFEFCTLRVALVEVPCVALTRAARGRNPSSPHHHLRPSSRFTTSRARGAGPEGGGGASPRRGRQRLKWPPWQARNSRNRERMSSRWRDPGDAVWQRLTKAVAGGKEGWRSQGRATLVAKVAGGWREARESSRLASLRRWRLTGGGHRCSGAHTLKKFRWRWRNGASVVDRQAVGGRWKPSLALVGLAMMMFERLSFLRALPCHLRL